MPRERKLYDVLGVSPEATQDEIKKAFRKLARAHHPDRNPDDPSAEARFKEVNAAHEILSDPEKRMLYDQLGEEGQRVGFDPDQARAYEGFRAGGGFGGHEGVFDMEDLLGELFGRQTRRPRGGTLRSEVVVDFRTAARGGERELRFADGRTLTVRIPPGVRDGESLRLRGEGAPGPDGPGDLVLTVHVTAHPIFARHGDDLRIVVPVTVGEALLGASIEVPTLDGPVKLKVPAGTQSGQRLRLRGKGIARRGQPPGDLFAEVLVRLPESVDDDVREAVEKLEASYRGDVREGLTRHDYAA